MSLARRETERRFVETLRPHYERKGYTFRSYPDKVDLPEFMGRYEPDAVALRADHNVAIEVKSGQNRAADLSLRVIRHIFEGHPDWQLRVFYVGDGARDDMEIPTSTPDQFIAMLAIARDLSNQGQVQAAFLLSWPLLESAARMREEDLRGRPQSPGTIVQALGMSGAIDPDTERRIRGLIEVRNRVVHGDLGAVPATEDVEAVLSAAEDVFRAGFGS